MYPPIFIRPRPTTILNTIDYFIMDLGEYGEYVCTEPQVNNDYYIGLVRLACNGDTSILDRLGTLDRYQGLLITYYLLFHKHDVGLARAVLNRYGHSALRLYNFDRFKFLKRNGSMSTHQRGIQ
jgi:hypothetical protein